MSLLFTSDSNAFTNSLAGTSFARRLFSRGITCAEQEGLPAAITDVISRRLNSEQRTAFVLVEDPRRALLQKIATTILSQPTRDAKLAQLGNLTYGRLLLNQEPQVSFESRRGMELAAAFRDLCVVSDIVLFRSAYERELASRMYGYRPTRTSLYSPLNPAVPQPCVAESEPSDSIVLWGDAIDAGIVHIALEIFAAIGYDCIVVRSTPDLNVPTISPREASPTLAAARVVVDLSDDVGTSLALARFNRPLASAAPGAAELLGNVAVFDIYDATRAVDAVLRSLGSAPPYLSDIGSTQTSEPQLPASPVFGAEAPLVSIVVTVYDRLQHLERTLNALQRQTYPNIEIIVVSNNGPRADEICNRFSNVRYIHRPFNSGAAAAPRNDGFRDSRGEYITAVDDDDVFFPDHIAQMVAACKNGARAVYSDFLLQIVEPQPDGSERLLGYDLEKGDGVTAYELLVTNRIGYMTVFVHRDVYDALGGYDEVRVKGGEEVELWLRIATKFPMAHIDRATTIYTIRKNWQGSLTSTDHARFADGYEAVYELYPADNLPLIEENRKRHLASLRESTAPTAREARYLVPHGTR